MPFDPRFVITAKTATALMRIEAARESIGWEMDSGNCFCEKPVCGRMGTPAWQRWIEKKKSGYDKSSSCAGGLF